MADAKSRNLGIVLLRIALACYFFVTGLCLLGLGSSSQEFHISKAVHGIFKADVANIVCPILGIVILLCGVLLIIEFFVRTGTFSAVIAVITLLIWLLVTVMLDFFAQGTGILNGLNISLLTWLLDFANNLMVIGALIAVKN